MGERNSRSIAVSTLAATAPLPGESPIRSGSSESRLTTPAPNRVQEIRKPVISSSRSQGPNDVGQARVETQDLPESPIFSDALTAIPSWLISTLVHVAILLILAFCTLSIEQNSHAPIVMEISDSPAEITSALLDISLAESELDDVASSLSDTDFESTQLDPVMLEPEVDDSSQIWAMPDEMPPIDLPEFRTAEEKKALRELQNQAESAGSGQTNSETDGSQSTDFFGTKAYGSRFVFVIDGSSSMLHYRWLRATRELISSINGLNEDQEFLVLVYNTSTTVLNDMRTDRAALISATEKNKKQAKIWLGSQRPRGGTLPARTMKLAVSLKPDAIYFLSDGELADDTLFLLQTWNAPKNDAKGLSRQIPIHTVLLGSRFGFLTMKTIAEQNNGIFTSVQ